MVYSDKFSKVNKKREVRDNSQVEEAYLKLMKGREILSCFGHNVTIQLP